MIKERNIVRNIYHMLSYAFRILREDGYAKLSVEEFENQQELYSAILAKGITMQVKKGLSKTYTVCTEPVSNLRGKIDIAASVKDQTIIRKQLVCSYDEFSENSVMNQILKSTAELLLRLGGTASKYKKALRKALVFFRNVSSINVRNINWSALQYNRNNQSYQMLINICFLVIEGFLHTEVDGRKKLSKYMDDQQMYRLYERFILEYFKKHHPFLNACASQIDWALDDDQHEFLPAMRSDITLSYENRVFIIDAKYYGKTMQYRKDYDSRTIHSGNLYQIFTYVKNRDKNGSGNVTGMLLYAKTDEEIVPDNEYSMSGNKIIVRTLDLSKDFSTIREQLEGIANRLYS